MLWQKEQSIVLLVASGADDIAVGRGIEKMKALRQQPPLNRTGSSHGVTGQGRREDPLDRVVGEFLQRT